MEYCLIKGKVAERVAFTSIDFDCALRGLSQLSKDVVLAWSAEEIDNTFRV